eukprot:Selendium_serpulae@DN4617_c0_g2_i1.p1
MSEQEGGQDDDPQHAAKQSRPSWAVQKPSLPAPKVPSPMGPPSVYGLPQGFARPKAIGGSPQMATLLQRSPQGVATAHFRSAAAEQGPPSVGMPNRGPPRMSIPNVMMHAHTGGSMSHAPSPSARSMPHMKKIGSAESSRPSTRGESVQDSFVPISKSEIMPTAASSQQRRPRMTTGSGRGGSGSESLPERRSELRSGPSGNDGPSGISEEGVVLTDFQIEIQSILADTRVNEWEDTVVHQLMDFAQRETFAILELAASTSAPSQAGAGRGRGSGSTGMVTKEDVNFAIKEYGDTCRIDRNTDYTQIAREINKLSLGKYPEDPGLALPDDALIKTIWHVAPPVSLAAAAEKDMKTENAATQ